MVCWQANLVLSQVCTGSIPVRGASTYFPLAATKAAYYGWAMGDSKQVAMAQAIRRQMDHAQASKSIDRTGWTRRQWVADARIQMADPDGTVSSLTNGHVRALLAEINHLAGQVERLKDGPGKTLTCRCDTGPTSDGPEQDCPIHGDVCWYAQWLVEAKEDIETLREQVERLTKQVTRVNKAAEGLGQTTEDDLAL